MKTVTFTEFREHASELFSEVEKGNSLLVLRHGKPIAEISPPLLQRGENPSWKRPGLRLTAQGAGLSSAILQSAGMKTFLDSSAFAKRYVDEPGSEAVDAICIETTELALSVICAPEVFSALNRRLRERKLTQQQYDEAKRRLSAEVDEAVVINLTSPVIAACIAILEGNPIRAMDALHIACALQWEADLFVSADDQQIAAAKKAGLPTKLIER